ncbi:MAG TPA: hypothetical protein VL688_07275 [Verrucomicrobiae bacterium]|nr:hypothetical protein [Verrucomicrobiae bacterium]
MFITLKSLRHFTLRAKDGAIGSIEDYYFDDREWILRHFVIETGHWLGRKQVLLSPSVFKVPDELMARLETPLTEEEIRRSPLKGDRKPASHRQEAPLGRYIEWPFWLAGLHASDEGTHPVKGRKTSEADPHLCSYEEVRGYPIEALNGKMGHVDDFLVGTKTWSIRYLIVDVWTWSAAKKVLLDPRWITGIGSAESRLYVSINKEDVWDCPGYDPKKALEENIEEALHYSRRKSWEKTSGLEKAA